MSAFELDPMHISSDDCCLPDLRTLEKTCGTLTPPTTRTLLANVGERLDLQDGTAQAFIVDLILRDGESPQKDDSKSTAVGKHQLDVTHRSPSLRDMSVQRDLPVPPNADVAPAEMSPTADSSDSESIVTPIEPPGLPRPDADTQVVEDGEVIPTAKDSDVACAAMVFEPPEPARTATPAPEPLHDLFSLCGLQSLRAFIPDDLLPDDLLVYDHDNITKLLPGQSEPQPNVPVRYVRIFPKASRESGGTSTSACADRSPDHPIRVAHLYLKTHNKLGTGHHSAVYSAPLRLRLDPASAEESTVRVAAKTAFAECGAHEMLAREAAAYNAFPRHLMEDRYPAAESFKVASVDPTAAVASDAAVAASDGADEHGTDPALDTAATRSEDSSLCALGPASGDADKEAEHKHKHTHSPEPGPAVVPKFFGYYAAVGAEGSVIEHSHPDCDEDDTCAVPEWPTRILLVEECGKPIDPHSHTREQRAECLNLVQRLHAAGFVQGSMYVRNIVVQPGPLSAPPEERSDDRPSWRIIDFGRVGMRDKSYFTDSCEDEVQSAKRVLALG